MMNDPKALYLDLMKKVLTYSLWLETGIHSKTYLSPAKLLSLISGPNIR